MENKSPVTEEKQGQGKVNPTVLKSIIALLIFLQVLVIAMTAIVLRNRGSGSSQTNGVSSIVPIWFVLLIPFFASRKKGQNEKQKKNILLIAIGLAILVLLAALTFLLKALKV